jgi:uncharacterized membrane protein
MRALKRFGLFWVDFVVGEDWTLAAMVVVALLVTWGLSRTGFPGWLAMVVIVLTALVWSVGRARRASSRKSRTK